MTIPLQALIVEDRKADAELVVQELKKAGFAVDWQRVDTERDLRLRLTPTLQVILSDYSLPGFTALDALAMVRESGLDVPFIVVSGSLGDDRAVECLKQGATDYILKDRMARLGPAVQRALQERQSRLYVKRTQQDLKRSQEQMQGILSTVEDVVWSLSLEDGHLLYLNPAAEKLTGRPVAEFLADPQRWLQTVHPEDYAKMAKAQEEAVRWGTYESEYRMVRVDGTVRMVALRAWTAYDPDGQPARLEGIITDITDKRAREQERIELEVSRREGERLKQLDAFRLQFIGMVAHDLNNVLTPMKINLRLAADEVAKTGAQSPHLTTLGSGVERLGAFLADLLDAARLQSGQLSLKRSDFDLAAKLRETVDALRAQAGAQGVGLTLDAPASLQANGDAHRLDQVVSNLLSNALKFTPQRGAVSVKVALAGPEVRLEVGDTGPGVAKEDLVKLFQPFSRLGPVPQGKHTGTGLGLFISRGIVEQHGGKIWCESKGAGQGATFIVTLPAKPAEKK